MKRTITLIAIALVATMGVSKSASAQAVGEGSFIIDPYYGGPTTGKNLVRTFFNSDVNIGENEFQIQGIGPAGIRVEYMLADNFGVGVDFIYKSISFISATDSLNNDNTIFETYDLKGTLERYRIQARLNYHFSQTDELDAYVGFGAGTNLRKISAKSDDPRLKELNESLVVPSILPVSLRIALGARYYFTDNIGINGEIGIGGPVLSAGISIKF